MAIIHALAVIVIVLLATLTVGLFLTIIAASLLVTRASRREDRLMTLTGPAPNGRDRLARWLLAAHARHSADLPPTVARRRGRGRYRDMTGSKR